MYGGGGKRSYGGGGGRGRGRGGGGRGRGGGGRGGGGGGGERPPPGLRGRDIGMWYASRQKGENINRDRKERPMVTMGADVMKEFLNLTHAMDTEFGTSDSDDHILTGAYAMEHSSLPSRSSDLYRKALAQMPKGVGEKVPKLEVKQEIKTEMDVDMEPAHHSTFRDNHNQASSSNADSGEAYSIKEELEEEVSVSMSSAATGDEEKRGEEEEDMEIEELVFQGGDYYGSSSGSPIFAPGRLQYNAESETRMKNSWKAAKETILFKKLEKLRVQLPVYQYKDIINDAIKTNQVIVVSGETGSGKSTQVPQFILDRALAGGRASETFVVVTQPRRISAISLAERVSEERGESLCNSVGYFIRLEGKPPRTQGSIMYCTYGILLRWLLGDKRIERVSHIVLDEIHERDLFSDFLLIIIRDLLPLRPDLKVILMSATINAELFSDYFGGARIIEVPGRVFPVTHQFLEDVIESTGYRPKQIYRRRIPRIFLDLPTKEQQIAACEAYFKDMEVWARNAKGKYSENTIDTVYDWDESVVDLDLITELVQHIHRNSPRDEAVLIFLPGWADISKLLRSLQERLGSSNFWIIPLHSLLPSIDQKKVFSKPPQGIRKIVIATNIAETSITVDDVVHVIDCGKIKMSNFDEENNIATLRAEWVSVANATQRRGRAGRVKSGYCYHLVSEVRFNQLEPFLAPEMKRTRIENLILQIKLLGLGNVGKFLVKAPEPPSARSLELALRELMAIGALFPDKEELTPLGWHLARLPVDPHCGKMIIYGAMFSCLDPVLTIASCLDYKDPFHTPMGKEAEVDEVKRMLLGDHSRSDYLLWASVVNDLEIMFNKDEFSKTRAYCFQNFIHLGTVKRIGKMKIQFAKLLTAAGFLRKPNPRDPEANVNSYSEEIISAITCAGLYPKVAESIPLPHENSKAPLRFATNPSNHWKNIVVHPKSVNFEVKKIPTRHVAYHQVMRSSKVFMHDCGMVSPLSLVLFAGSFLYKKEQADSLIVIDGWIKFHCSADVMEVLSGIRRELGAMLRRRINSPKPLIASWTDSRSERASLEETFLNEIALLLKSEGLHFKY